MYDTALMGRAVLFLAWTALVLPWERCHSDCHDRVLPSVVTHPCQEDPCCGDPAPTDGTHHEADHERIDFFSLKPKFVEPLTVVPALDVLVEVASRNETVALPARAAPESSVRQTVVLLL